MYDDLKREIQETKSRIDWISNTLVNVELPYLTDRLKNLEDRLNRLEEAQAQEGINDIRSEQFRYRAPVVTEAQGKINDIAHTQNGYGLSNKKILTEENIGKYIIGILASLLILVSLGLFIGLVWGAIPNIIKFISILGFGLVISGVSLYIISNKQVRNGFTLALSSCGQCIVFSSILFGHITWELYNVYIAGLAIMVWYVCTLHLAKKITSYVHIAIAYIGSILTLIQLVDAIRYDVGKSEATLIGNGSQLIILAVLVICISIAFVEQYKFTGLRLNNISSSLSGGIDKVRLLVILMNYGYLAYIGLWLSTFVCRYTTGLSILVVASVIIAIMCAKLANKIYKPASKVYTIAGLMQYISVAIILYSTANVVRTFEDLETREITASIICIVCMLILSLACKERQLTVSTIVAVPIGYSLCKLSYYMLYNDASLAAIVAIVILLLEMHVDLSSKLRDLGQNTLGKNESKLAISIQIAIYYGMAFIAYLSSSVKYTEASNLIAFILMLGLPVIHYINSVTNSRENIVEAILQIVDIFIALFVLWKFVESNDIEIIHICIIVVCWGIVHRFLMVENIKSHIVVGNIGISALNALIYIIVVLRLSIFSSSIHDKLILQVEASMLLATMSASGLYHYIRNNNKIMTVIQIILTNINVGIITNILINDNQNIITSVLCITLSALFITLGFKIRSKSIRVTGLILTIIHVLRLTLISCSMMDYGLFNIVTIFFGGVICFVISYLYNRLDKKYSNNIDKIK